jgi:hypothetical protein
MKGALNGGEELIIQASYELRNVEFATPKQRNEAVLKRAMELKYRSEGRLMPLDARDHIPIKLPQRNDGAPIMPNVRVHQVVAEDRFDGYRDRFMPGMRRGQRPTATRMRAAAPSAAERPAPVLGTVQSQPIGRVGPGVHY